MAPDPNSALYIERLHQRYVVPLGDQLLGHARNLSEDAIAARLPDALEDVLRHSFVSEDTSLWFIPRLEVGFALNPEIHESQLAEIWAVEIAAGLVDALQRRDPEILRFPDEADYLSHFLLDLAEGSAWNKWYYSQFDGLRLLPVSAAIRTAICDAPEVGGNALRLFSETQCAAVIRATTAADAERILKTIACSPAAADDNRCFEAISRLWPAGLVFQPEDETRRSLSLFVACCRKDPSLASENLCAAVIASSRLARCLYEQPGASQAILSAIGQYKLAALVAAVGLEQSQVLAPLLRCAPDCIESLLQRITGEPLINAETRRETRFTAFGGAFLLFPLLDEFPFAAITAGWPELEETDPATIVRFLVLAKSLGAQRARGCLQDSSLRDLMHIPPQIDLGQLSDWLDELTPAHLQTLFTEAAKWHLDFGVIGGENFVLTQAAHKDISVTILFDAARGLWVFATPAESMHGTSWAALDTLPQPQRLLCDESLLDAARNVFTKGELDCLTGQQAGAGFRLSSLPTDLEFLSLPRDICNSPAVDLALSVIAQTVLRRFAWKLPGFALSSLEYLYRNFLDCCAAVEHTKEQNTVCLGRPPLHLVLGIAGLNRRSYRLSWLGNRPCSIFPEG